MPDALLRNFDANAWNEAHERVAEAVHDVDRNATRIWFHFYPLALADALEQTTDPARQKFALRLDGQYRLAEQCDTSHWFFYGHRYWPLVKSAIVAEADTGAHAIGEDLVSLMRRIGGEVARAAAVDESLVLGITAVGLMTLRQVGLPLFRLSPGVEAAGTPVDSRTPEAIVGARQRDRGQGLKGWLRGAGRAEYQVRFDERRRDGWFTIVRNQHVTTAAAKDTRDYSSATRPSLEGPIPVQCRSGSCGTCWIGVLGGSEKLSPVDALEARRLKEFGYINPEGPHPPIRLACMAAASGNVTIVIPPWNGVLGKAALGNDQTTKMAK